MSKKSKTTRSEKRKKEKKAKKAAKAALYKSYSEKGSNKSKKNKKKNRIGPSSNKNAKGSHEFICGNVGCKKCRPKMVRAGLFPKEE